jgi:hypothetical protein
LKIKPANIVEETLFLSLSWLGKSMLAVILQCFLRATVCQDMTAWNPGKLQSYKIEELCLMLNCTSPCTNPLSQLQKIVFIVVARFTSAIPIGRLLHYKKMQ